MNSAHSDTPTPEQERVRLLFTKIKTGDKEILAALVQEEPELASARNEQGVSALMFARYQFRLDLVDLLRPHVKELDAIEAAGLGEVDELTRILAANPSQAMLWSADGFTPLHLAAFFGHANTLRQLLQADVDVNAVAKNPTQLRPIHSAAASRQVGLVRLLADAGADLNTQQHGGFSPLHSAAHQGNVEMVELLLAKGADSTLKTDEGKTAADLVPGDADPAVRELLNGSG